MSLETDLAATLRAICPRVFPDEAPTSTERPYVIFQQIGGAALGFLDSAIPSKRNALVQVDVWAATRAEANALALQIEAAMLAAQKFTGRPQGALRTMSEADLQLRGARQDFDIWADR